MLLRFQAPLTLSDHFAVPVDQTAWTAQEHHSCKHGWAPVRPRASFVTWQASLLAQTQHGRDWERSFGIYLLAADVPSPTLYVGIAAQNVKSSEGLGKRLKKHRVKTTASHVGASATSTGGVHHPKRWQNFARARFVALAGQGDGLQDVRVTRAAIEGVAIQAKTDLQRFENSIMANHNGVLQTIVDRLWPGTHVEDVRLLNGAQGRRKMGPEDQIMIWSAP